MALLRPTTVVAGLKGEPLPRYMISTTGVQLVSRGKVIWAKKPFWLRNPPYTVGPYAHNGQIEIRLWFAEVAKTAKGKKGLVMTDIGPLPPAAAAVHEKLKGVTAPDRMSPEEYPSKKRRTAYTYEELVKIAEKRGIRARVPV